MARTYVVKRGDTLRKIARARLGDAALYRRIAEYNGIRDPNRIAVGQRLEIPSRRELRTCGGCFNFRAKHAWGVAIDLNPMHFQFCGGY